MRLPYNWAATVSQMADFTSSRAFRVAGAKAGISTTTSTI
jgi:hypothetical protein